MLNASNIELADFWRLAATAGWCFIYGVWLDFSITLRFDTGNGRYAISRLLLYVLPAIFFTCYAGYGRNVELKTVDGYWKDFYPATFVNVIFIAYSLLYTLTGLLLIHGLGRRSGKKRIKKQAGIIVATTSVAFAISIFTDIVLPAAGVVFYNIGVIFFFIGVAGVWHAVTKYRLMDFSVKMASDYIYKAVEDPIIYIGDDFIVKDANIASLKMSGHDMEGLKRNLFQNVIPMSCGDFYMLIEKGAVTNMETHITRKNGDVLECLLSGSSIPDRFGDVMGYVVVLHDMSERKKNERMLRDYNMELETRIIERTSELEKANNAKSEFLSNVSHELRTPLNVILSAIQLFNLYIGDEGFYRKDKASKHLKTMRQNCLRLIRLVNNILDTTKIDSGSFELSPQNCDITGVAKMIIESTEDYIKMKGISLHLESETAGKVIACDLNALERILMNLVSNAIKFSKAGGSIWVRLFCKPGYVCISVRDDGIGIPEDMKDAVFERFKQVNGLLTREREGSGIGLALTKALVEMHGGRILLESEFGKGSEFTVELPDKTMDGCGCAQETGRVVHSIVEKINVEFSDIYDIS